MYYKIVYLLFTVLCMEVGLEHCNSLKLLYMYSSPLDVDNQHCNALEAGLQYYNATYSIPCNETLEAGLHSITVILNARLLCCNIYNQ